MCPSVSRGSTPPVRDIATPPMRTLLLSVLPLAIACGGNKPATTAPAPPPDKTEAKPADVAEAPTPVPAKPTKPVTNVTLAAIGLDPTALDRKADPCND